MIQPAGNWQLGDEILQARASRNEAICRTSACQNLPTITVLGQHVTEVHVKASSDASDKYQGLKLMNAENEQ